jgi:hypothetical protein
MLISQVLYHAGEQARALGMDVIGPELLLLGVVTDIQTPWPRCMNNRWRRQLYASVGLPEHYRGAGGPLLEPFGVDLDRLGAALTAELGAGVPSAGAIEESCRMDGSGSGGSTLFDRFTEPALMVLDRAREEAERYGHRYLGPEHVLLGVLAEGHSGAARVLRPVGWTWQLPEPRSFAWPIRGWCRRRGPVTASCCARWASTWIPSDTRPSRPSASRQSGRRPGG